MVRTLYDENVAKQKALEIAKRLLKKGLSVEDTADSTGLDIEIIEVLQDQEIDVYDGVILQSEPGTFYRADAKILQARRTI